MDRKEDERGLIRQLVSFFDTRRGNDTSGSDSVSGEAGVLHCADLAAELKEFVDEIPGGFFIYRDDTKKILFVNKALLRIFGCGSFAEFEKLTGNTFTGMVHPDDIERVEASIHEQIAHNQDELDYVEYRILRKDGTVRWVEDFGHYVHSASMGDMFYVFVTDATDKITRRFALMSAKNEKVQKLKTLIEEYDKERKLIRQEHLQRLEVIEGLSINYESILYADMDADLVLPYRLSTRLERQFEKKLQAKPFRRFLRDYAECWVHPDDRGLVLERTSPEYIIKKMGESPTFYVNYRCIQNGETKYLQLRMANVGDGERIGKLVMGYRNIDVEVLQEIKHKQILEDALRNARVAEVAKNSFLSNMSHDMRTPLNAIFGFTMLARNNINNAEVLRSYLDRIEETGKQMLDLVDKVLALSYTEAQDMPLLEAECSVSELMCEVCASISQRAKQKNISVELKSAITHDAVLGDKDKLKQLLTHLASNAVTYTENGGHVTVAVTERDASVEEFATYKFEITDDGIGISPEVLPRIFEPFEREKNTTFSGVYGTGLGLTIAKHITESMGGHIEVASEVGTGSTFTVTLGFRLPKNDACAADGNDADLADKKILLVDDNEINLEIETEILEELGFEVDTAANGRIAVDKVRASAPREYALVLIDIQMPVMDGREATRAIRKLDDPAHSRLPIVALSANAFDVDRRASIECGMDEHLAKPLDVPLLLQTVSKILAEKR